MSALGILLSSAAGVVFVVLVWWWCATLIDGWDEKQVKKKAKRQKKEEARRAAAPWKVEVGAARAKLDPYDYSYISRYKQRGDKVYEARTGEIAVRLVRLDESQTLGTLNLADEDFEDKLATLTADAEAKMLLLNSTQELYAS